MYKPNVMLVAYYNKKALGVRYLEAALTKAGYSVYTVFYKDFNSVNPTNTTQEELRLLKEEIEKRKPLFIGLSVMSSMYLDTVNRMIDMIQAHFTVPILCGGAFATMFPEYFLNRGVQFVIRGDGEHAVCRLAAALEHKTDYTEIPSLCFWKGSEMIINQIGDILNDIDGYGIPTIHSKNACYIEHNTLRRRDPQLDTLSYEVITSRGCPFNCSYCCCSKLRQLLPSGVKGVRIRSVKSVIDELVEAKAQCRHIAFIHFYDEIFPNLPGWVDEFVIEYKKHVNLPFSIWSHPKIADYEVLKKLVSVGLVEVIMGIQSGSEHIRRDVFHRYETQQDIIAATKAIQDAGVFWASYDFMLQHPFESVEDLKETYWLVKGLYGPFELQLHGLNFLPGTDIVPMAVEAGYYTQPEMERIMFAPMEEQFSTYWQCETSKESQLWYRMIYCLQFQSLRKKIQKFEQAPLLHETEINRAYRAGQRIAKLRYLHKKSSIVLKRLRM